MDNKGIELQGLNLLSAIQVKDLQKEKPAIKPVEKASKGNLYADVKKGKASEKDVEAGLSTGVTEEDASNASKIMADLLRDMPDLESDWKYDQEHGMLVVVIKNKTTGEIIRQIPPEEILSGHFMLGTDAAGNIIDKTA